LLADGPVGAVAFAMAAMEQSRDATRSRGGQIEPFSTADPAYPESVRQALDRMNPGDLSPVIAIEAGFALLLLEQRSEPESVQLEDIRPHLTRELRLRQERILMQDLALELVDTTQVTPVDRALGWSWQRRQENR
jgi:parvulin-like peptidyl-prolyl isomerase